MELLILISLNYFEFLNQLECYVKYTSSLSTNLRLLGIL